MNRNLTEIGSSEDIKKYVYLQRHGERVGFESDEWTKSSRYQENPFDPPLTEKGHTEIQNNIKFMKGIEYIYSSPLTRCMESATEISNLLNIPIRVEYGLVESHTFEQADTGGITYENGKIFENNKPYKTIVDSKLELSELAKIYPVDTTYKSIYEILPIIEEASSLKERHEKLIDVLSKDNAVIVCHQDFIENATKRLTNFNTYRKEYPFYPGGSKWYGVLIKLDINDAGMPKAWLNGKKVGLPY